MRPPWKFAATPLLLLATAVLLVLAAGSPASACSVVQLVAPPTNYELVREAQVIVLAKAVSAKPSADEERHPWGSILRFEVEEVLKGDFQPSSVTLDGHLEFGGRGTEDDFSEARPGAYAGSCLAYDYRLNHQYVLFLEWSELEGQWAVSGPAFSRVNEEVDVPDSPWLKTVRHYVRTAALQGYDPEKLALRELRAKAAAGANPKDFPKALAKDIDRHFQTPSAAKSGADLIDLYEHAESVEARREALKGLGLNAPPAAKVMLRQQLLKETRPDWLGPLGNYFSTVQDHEILGPLARGWDHLPANSWTRRELLRALANAAGPADVPLMTELLRKAADDDQASVLAQWFATSGVDTRAAIDILRKRLEDTPGDFTRYQSALALLGDPAVVAWAEKRIWKDSETTDWRAPEVLAKSPLPEADAAARKIIESGGSKRVRLLITAFFLAKENPKRWDRLDDILRSQSTNATLLAELKTQSFYLRRDGPDADKPAANRLYDRTREAIAALPHQQP